MTRLGSPMILTMTAWGGLWKSSHRLTFQAFITILLLKLWRRKGSQKKDLDVSNERSEIEKSMKTWSEIEYHCHEDAAVQLDQHSATRLIIINLLVK
ncbi:hypothetical protein ELQ35_05410 [Peribacillus cavernae]|uniref:Uncharacterized protein n=1 Tax=Peribacillus cavernae TaxID=1674310 RepID=A0A3S0VFB1_9BACI|nr:hypothetical protein [Peribacillus cavernae]MDQ0218819.1 hypothetical protein [Peribacillus cavernae]RUQ31025.1 hypothetical protein ELQ35_05410 [Peribacillus cavernae]